MDIIRIIDEGGGTYVQKIMVYVDAIAFARSAFGAANIRDNMVGFFTIANLVYS